MTQERKWTDDRIDDLDGKVDSSLEKVDKRFDKVEEKIEGGIKELRGEMNARFDTLDAKFDKKFDRLTYYIWGLGAGVITTLIASLAAVLGPAAL
jgi:hypothetical protein